MGGGFGPAEGLGVFVPVRQVTYDRLLQAPEAGEAATADGLAGDPGEPALDQLKPRGARWGEVHMETRMRGQPLLDRRMLVGAIVVADQMPFSPGVAAGQ